MAIKTIIFLLGWAGGRGRRNKGQACLTKFKAHAHDLDFVRARKPIRRTLLPLCLPCAWML